MKRIALSIVLFLAATPLLARDCGSPVFNRNGYISERYVACLRQEIEELKQQQTQIIRSLQALQTTLEEAQEALKSLPGTYRNRDGQISQDEDRTLAVAFYHLTARPTGGINGLGIDQTVLETLCSSSACTFTLSLRPQSLRETDAVVSTIIGPCILDYDSETGVWVRSGTCGPSGANSGKDGNGTPSGNTGSETIAIAGGACILADSDPGLNVGPENGPLGRDHAKGLYLIAAPDFSETTDDRFECELKISNS